MFLEGGKGKIMGKIIGLILATCMLLSVNINGVAHAHMHKNHLHHMEKMERNTNNQYKEWHKQVFFWYYADQYYTQLPKQHQEKVDEKIKEESQLLSIDMKNKTMPQLIKEIYAKKLEKHKDEMYTEAKEMNIATEGKSLEDIAKEIVQQKMKDRKEALLKKAQELGVATEGKSLRDIAKEVREVEHNKTKPKQ
jgi:hypothetical protein